MVGSALRTAMRARGIDALTTSRRETSSKLPDVLWLDLSTPEGVRLSIVPRSAFLCAANSAFIECEKNGDATYRVNVSGSILISKQLLSDGAFVIFISSSAVFEGLEPFPKPNSVRSPTTAYGKQKAEAEQQLLELDQGRGNVAIVRLTKVFTQETPVIRRFLQNLTKRERFDAFADLYMSPISLPYVVDALLEIERLKIGGIHHLSGNLEMSYAEFARRLAERVGAPADLVSESTVEQSPVPVLYRPRHPALSMALTTEATGVKPEPIDIMLDNLLGHIAA